MTNDEEWHVFKCGAEDMCECRSNSANEKKKKKKKRGKIGKGDFREGGKNYKKENKKKMVECRWSGPIRA